MSDDNNILVPIRATDYIVDQKKKKTLQRGS